MLYLTGRFVRRHRAPVAFASILIATLTTALILVSGSLARESQHRSQVEREQLGLKQIIATVGSSLDAVNHPETGEAPLTSLLREMARQADLGTVSQPLAEAAIRRMVAKSFRQAGHLDDAAAQLAAAESLYRSAASPANPDWQACLLDLANLHADLDNGIYDLPRAAGYAREVLDTREQLYGPNDPRTMDAIECLAIAARNLGHGKESGLLYDRLIPWLESQPSVDSRRLVSALMTKGFTLHRKGTLDQADVWYRKAADLASIHLEATDPVRIEATTLQALSLRDRNRFDEASAIYDELLTDLIRLTPPESISLLRECMHHSMVLGRGGRVAAGMRVADAAIERIEPHLPADHPALLLARAGRLKLTAWNGDVPGALRSAEELWSLVHDSDSLPAMSIRSLGRQCSTLLNDQEACSRWQDRIGEEPAQKQRLLDAGDRLVAAPLQKNPAAGCARLSSVLSIGIRLLEIGELESGVAILRDVAATAKAARRPAWYVTRSQLALARALDLQGQDIEAAEALATAIAQSDVHPGGQKWLADIAATIPAAHATLSRVE